VLGKTFTREAVAALSGLGDEQLEPLLMALVRKEVLGVQADPRSPEHGQYGFLQDLVRHVAYATLSKRERRGRHLAAAQYLTRAFVGEQDEVVEVVASHYVAAYEALPDSDDAAELKQRAGEVLTQAGERAASLAAAAEARRYFQQASELLDEPGERARVLARAGWMAYHAADPEASRKLLTESIALYESVGKTHAAARVTGMLGFGLAQTGDREAAVEQMERAFEAISGDEPDEDLALLAARLGVYHWFLGNLERSAELAEFALDIAEAYAYVEPLEAALRCKGVLAFGRGHPEEAAAYHSRALQIALAHDLLRSASTLYFISSDGEFRRDRYEAALELLRDSLALSRKLGNRPSEYGALAEMSYPLYMLGRWDEALASLESPTEEHTQSGGVVLSLLQGPLEIYIARGQLEEARRLHSLFAHLEGSTDVQDRSSYLAARATLNVAEGRFAEALADADDAMAAASTLGFAAQAVKQAIVAGMEAATALGDTAKVEELVSSLEEAPPARRAPFLEGQALRFRARLAADEAGYNAADSLFRELGLPFWLAVVLLERAELLMVQDRAGDAEPLLAEAREIFERLDATVWLERVARVVPIGSDTVSAL
jgi:tetratricopeptide (TPR) repeat protein